MTKNIRTQEIENKIEQGFVLFDQRKHEEALSIFMECAKAGNARAMNAVGYVHEYGSINGKRNIDKAAEWYAKAAVAGYPAAHYNLGRKYFSDCEYEKGVEHLEVAVSQNYPYAIVLLARILSREGRFKNIGRSVELYTRYLDQSGNYKTDNAKYIETLIEMLTLLGNQLNDKKSFYEWIKKGLLLEPENSKLKMLNERSEENRFDFVQWINETLPKPYQEPGNEEDYPPYLALNSTGLLHVYLIDCNYYDEEHNDNFSVYDVFAELSNFRNGLTDVMASCIKKAVNEFGKPFECNNDSGGELYGDTQNADKWPKAFDKALIENADSWKAAWWNMEEKAVVLLLTEWAGDGEYSFALHAIVTQI